jgi:hypothetical protein
MFYVCINFGRNGFMKSAPAGLRLRLGQDGQRLLLHRQLRPGTAHPMQVLDNVFQRRPGGSVFCYRLCLRSYGS